MEPLALYAAAVSTVLLGIRVWEFLSNAPDVRFSADPAWPDFTVNNGDLGGDPGPTYVRITLANIGNKAVGIDEVGLTFADSGIESSRNYSGTARFSNKPFSLEPATPVVFDMKAE